MSETNPDCGTVGFWEDRCVVLERALELACGELSELSASSESYGDTMTTAIRPAAGFEIRFLTQAEAELKEANHGQD